MSGDISDEEQQAVIALAEAERVVFTEDKAGWWWVHSTMAIRRDAASRGYVSKYHCAVSALRYLGVKGVM